MFLLRRHSRSNPTQGPSTRLSTRSRTLGRSSGSLVVAILWVLFFSPATLLSQGLLVEALGLDDGLPSPSILDLAQDPSGRVWILTRLGTAIYDGRTLDTFVGGDGLFSSTLDRLVVDSRGRAWASSRRNARVFMLRDGQWSSLPHPPPTTGIGAEAAFLKVVDSEDSTMIVSATGEAEIWIWYLRDEEFSEPVRAEGSPIAGGLRAVEPYRNGLALGTDSGLCELGFNGLVDCNLRDGETRLSTPIHALHREVLEQGESRLWILAEKPVHRPGADLTEAWLGYWQDGKLVTTHPDLPPLMLRPRQADNFKTHLLVDPSRDIYFGNNSAIYTIDFADHRLATLDLQQGLASTGTTCLLQDREGNIWVGGSRGLSRVGSRRFQSFDRRHGLVEDEVTTVLEPSPGRFIFGHNLGLSILDQGNIQTLPFEKPSGSARNDYRVLDMASDAQGQIWMATSNAGLLRFNGRNKITPELPEIRVARSLAHDPQGNLWLLTDQGLFEQTEVGFALRHQPEGIVSARWLTFTHDGTFLVTTTRGLLMLRPGEDWQVVHAPSVEGDNLFGAIETRSREIWLGSAVGPFRLHNRQLVPFTGEFPRFTAPVFSILEDPAGRIWFGTDNGVRLWDGQTLRHLTVRHGLSGRETNRGAGFVDSQGRVWIGTDGGISLYRQSHDQMLTPPQLELIGLEADHRIRELDQALSLRHTERDLTFHFRAVGLSKEEPLLIEHQLEGLETTRQGPAPLSASEIRYTRLAPGTYRLRIRAGWQNGPWSDEKISPWIRIPPPFWQTKLFSFGFLALGLGLVLGIYRLRTRAMSSKALELEAMNRKLREAAEERERLIESLEAQNVELERFSFTVSHDLKSPLLTIRGFVGCLREAHKTGRFENVDQDLARIDSAAEKMGTLLDELLELARIGHVLYPSDSISLSTLIDEVLELSAAEIEERGIRVEVDPDLPWIFGDHQRLRMVFQNLVDNAIKFTHDQAQPRIAVHGHEDGSHTWISIEDNGLGIAPEHHDQIFGLFKRLNAGVPGTGVGLALIKRIIEAHGGEIRVESEGLGCGSRFVISLPKNPEV